MCLYTEWKEPKIATKDIVAYKALTRTEKGTYEAPFQNIRVKINEMVYARNVDTYKKVKLRKENLYLIGNRGVYRGLHGYLRLRDVKFHFDNDDFTAYFRMIIPKGSQYFISHDKTQIASNQAIYKPLRKTNG